MTGIVFDDAVASEFGERASALAHELSNQASAREQSVNDAAYQFDGAYADLFVQFCAQEAEDRRKLVAKLRDLVEEVQHAVVVARQEKNRIKKLREWELRESNRRAITLHNATFPPSLKGGACYDPEPPDVALTPPTISCSTTIVRRARQVSSRSSNSKSSAHPDRLDDFCGMRRHLDHEIEQKKKDLERAWMSFCSACSWVRFDSFTIIHDINAYLMENELDAVWVSRIAQAFRDANQSSLHDCLGYVNDIILGAAAGTLKHVRGIYVPVSTDAIPMEALKPRSINSSIPRETIFGKKFFLDPKTNLYLPDRLDTFPRPPEALTSAKNIKTNAFLSTSTEAGANVRWAQTGGKALGIIGVGITVWGNYSEEYNEELLNHPEWPESEVRLRAVQQAAIVSGAAVSTSVVGSMAGAKLGTVIGGTIGSVVPGLGTAIGAAVGGIAGAVLGGFAGGLIGHKAGKILTNSGFGR